MSDADYDPYYAMQVRCDQCAEQFTIHHPDDMADHIRLLHSDMPQPLERWPDGLIVIHDQTLKPDDFGGQQ